MDNRVRSISLAAALMLTLLALFFSCGAFADADPIRVSSLSEPQSVISEQDVSITIKIYNSSQTDMLDEITLFNPGGISVEKYSGLKGEQSVTYTGTWRVTAEEIAKGKINYFIRYMVDTGSGPKETVRTIPVTIQTEAAAPQLTATYSVSPVSAREGQTVSLSYTLSNTGNVELRNIVVENDGVSKEELVQPSLSVGEKVTLTDSFTMGTKELVSKPTITYQAADSKKELKISDMARKTITVAEDGLEVSLKASATENIYPGEAITLTLEMKNTGNTAYTALNAQLSDGTELASGVDLAPGASHKAEVEWAAKESGVISASVSGLGGSGEPVGVVSEELSVTTQDATRALVLSIQADAETDVIHSEPAVVRFGVVVSNIGQTDATTLTIEQAGTTVAKIPSLPSGESRTVVFDLQTSIAGKFQFVVSGRDADGNEKSYKSNVLQLSYLAPTPTPTAVPTPTPVPPTPTPAPTATPVPTLGDVVSRYVDLTVLYIVAGVLAAMLALILIVSGVKGAKRKKRLAQAIDTLELSPDVRNHRGTARRRRKDANAGPKKDQAAEEENDTIVPAAELTEEEAQRMHEEAAMSATPARDAMRSRRRAMQEVTDDETLRVAPVDQRPEFIAQGAVDDSQTRVFNRMQVQEAIEEAVQTAAPAAQEQAEELKQTEGIPDQAIEELYDADWHGGAQAGAPEKPEEPREDPVKGKAGKKRSEIKPLKKKKKSFLFGRKKKEEEDDDFLEDDDYIDADEDDLFE